MQECIGEKQPSIRLLQAFMIASHFKVVISPCQINNRSSEATGFRVWASVIPRSVFLCCKYSSCTIRNSSSIDPGIRTFIRERSKSRCPCTSLGILGLRIRLSSFKRYSIKYNLLSFWFIILTSSNQRLPLPYLRQYLQLYCQNFQVQLLRPY